MTGADNDDDPEAEDAEFAAACAKFADDLMQAFREQRLDVIIEVLTTCLATAIVSVSETGEEASGLAGSVGADLAEMVGLQWNAKLEEQ